MKIFLILMAIGVILAMMNADIRKNKKTREDFATDLNRMKKQQKELKKHQKHLERMEANKEISSSYDRYLTKKSSRPIKLNRNY